MIYFKHIALIVGLGAGAVVLTGVSGCSESFVVKRPEPQVIVATNRSGIALESVTLSSGRDAVGSSTRFGSISPVPRGVSQVFVRPTDPPRLPETVLVEWIDSAGARFSRMISLKDTLSGATGSPGQALVFEFGPGGDLSVHIEHSAERSAK